MRRTVVLSHRHIPDDAVPSNRLLTQRQGFYECGIPVAACIGLVMFVNALIAFFRAEEQCRLRLK